MIRRAELVVAPWLSPVSRCVGLTLTAIRPFTMSAHRLFPLPVSVIILDTFFDTAKQHHAHPDANNKERDQPGGPN
jgi:hypothetical protein